MSRKDFISWVLVASAMGLAGLLLFSLRGRFSSPIAPAHAAMVPTPVAGYVMLTARITGNDERLFVIDNPRHSLLVYTLEENNKQLVPELVQDLETVFTAIGGKAPEQATERVPR